MGVILGKVLGFLGGISIKQYIYMGIAALALTLALKGFNAVQAHFAYVKNLEEANTELVIQKQAMEIEKKQNQVVINALESALATQAEAINIITDEFSEARDEAEKQKRVLEGSRLGRLAADRAARIEDLSNSATAERKASIEEIINEDI